MKITLYLLCLLMCSCAIQMKKDDKKTQKARGKSSQITKQEYDPINTAVIKYDKPQNWANYYYQKTYLKVKNPIVVDNYKQLMTICKGDDIPFLAEYQRTTPAPVEYKTKTISIKTKTGFNEKAYVSRGACRELSLFKSPKLKQKGQFRKYIKSMNLIYIYNIGTYVKDITFGTQFPDVEFYVE